jgi:deoxyadenosine/deoxycytidine kinase
MQGFIFVLLPGEGGAGGAGRRTRYGRLHRVGGLAPFRLLAPLFFYNRVPEVTRGRSMTESNPIPPLTSLPFRHLAIDGPIGVGKTSLVERLARRFESTAVFEDVQNPFLEDFYRDKKGAAFRTQMFFVMSRYEQMKSLAQRDLFHPLVITDYTFAKDKIFAYLNLDDTELRVYDRLYALLVESVPKPDLVVYLQGEPEVISKRIRARGRGYERGISPEYLREVVEAYNYYFYHYRETPLLVVNTNEIDFVHRNEDFEDLVAQIAQIRAGVQHYVPAGGRKGRRLI